MEAEIIQYLIKNGFSNLWRRTRKGVAFGWSRYTPDVELSILHDGMNRRALVEFKPNNASEFPIDRRIAMLTSRHFYPDALCYLYVHRTNRWYLVEPQGKLVGTTMPVPGGVSIDKLARPKMAVPIMNSYGRSYWVRPHHILLKKAADVLEFFIKTTVRPTSKKRRRR